MTCTCIAISHPFHEENGCAEPPTYRGGICNTCRYYVPEFVKCPLCGDPERPADIVGGVCLTCADAIAFSHNARRASIEVKT